VAVSKEGYQVGAVIPASVAETELSCNLKNAGLIRIHQGKVRDTYAHPDEDNLMIVVATDRVSIFDFVLPIQIPSKGEVLTALTHFWLKTVLNEFPNHLEPSYVHPDLNAIHDLKARYPDLPIKRSLVVRRAEIPPYEMIFRHHLGGSVYKKYLETGRVGGHRLLPGLAKWSLLDEPLFTPSTKEEQGHDVNIDARSYFNEMGDRGRKAVYMFGDAYMQAYEYARDRGILILDTKFEGVDMIADEVLTPDSSRFTTLEDFEKATQEGRDPIFYDKQVVREWGKTIKTPWGVGLNKLDPTNPEHLAFVASLNIPGDVINLTADRYYEILHRLTGTN
jgi:phosphoribosylaminoimidazole-succinocarboxamide synthase